MIDRYLNWQRNDCVCGREHTIETSLVWIAPDAIDELPHALQLLALGRRGAVLYDRITRAVAGERVVDRVRSAGYTVQALELPDRRGVGHPVCSVEAVAVIEAELEPVDWLLAVGAGTINDLAKMVSFRRSIPFAVVATAPSMNGYTSSIVAILEAGVKRTKPAHQPLAVFAEPNILAEAPARLIHAGVGDLLSKPVSQTDWVLSREVLGEYFCPLPGELVDRNVDALFDDVAAIARRDPAALGRLMETIVLSGFSMALAGTSSPASGGEHLLSHYWDMGRYARDQAPLALHGTQVGIASILTARLYERLLELESLPAPRPLEPADEAGLESWVQARHSELPDFVVDGIIEQSRAKWREVRAQDERLEALPASWPMLRSMLADASSTRHRIEPALAELAAPVRPEQIAVDRPSALHTLRVCRDIRSRYSILDFLARFGLLEPWVEDVLE
ncbi:MAG: sn-glycerol-1-phosphate dehydrogenase [Myxococcales bacterium]|nr:sn-glycerol-1-phosphate dehydrogenase [Myxococcales bacterium]